MFHPKNVNKLLRIFDCFNMTYNMEYQKIIYLLSDDRKSYATLKTRKWIIINAEPHKNCDSNYQIKFKTSSFRVCLCNFSKSYIFATDTILVKGAATRDRRNRILTF